MTKDNKQIGLFNLDGIAPAKRGVPQIEVTFDIDANGILSVSAVDKGTGAEQKITIESKSSLTDEDIERMKKEAEEHAEEDKKQKETIEAINSADSFVFFTEKTLENISDKITEEQKVTVETKLDALRQAISTKDVDTIEKAKEEFIKIWDPIMDDIYKLEKVSEETNGDTGNIFNDMFNANNPFAK